MLIYVGNMLIRQRGFHSQDELNASDLALKYPVKQLGKSSSQLLRLLEILSGITIRIFSTRLVFIGTFSTRAFLFAWWSSRICKLAGIPYIPVVHGGNLPQRLLDDPRRTGRYFREAAHIITPSRYLENWLRQQGWDCSYIPNTLKTGLYNFKGRTSIQPHILWVRSFMPIYQPMEAMKALQLLLKQYPAARMTMVGEGPLRAECQQWAAENLEAGKITFTGKLSREEWVELAPGHDIFLNSSAIDNQPVSVLEAMALGLAVVSTNAGGMPWLLQQGTFGTLGENTDAQTLADALQLCLENQEISLKKIELARAEVATFNWKSQEENWTRIIEKYRKQ